jgi:hypothetical protein
MKDSMRGVMRPIVTERTYPQPPARQPEAAGGQPMSQFEVWMEGYRVTGDHGTARLIGRTEAATFQDACAHLMAQPPWNDGSYDYMRNAHWGCRLFDNEADARKLCG